MADTIYVGDVGTEITVDCGQDIAGAAGTRLLVKTPLGLTKEWPAAPVAVDGRINFLRYVTSADDLAEPGTYLIQPALTLGGWSGAGKTVRLTVKARFA